MLIRRSGKKVPRVKFSVNDYTMDRGIFRNNSDPHW